MAPKVDAKIELIRVHIQHELTRVEHLPGDPQTPRETIRTRSERISTLRWVLDTIANVEERV